jgi:hypothetical protein
MAEGGMPASSWWHPYLNQDFQVINSKPFDEQKWRGVVSARVPHTLQEGVPGWYGRVLVKGRFLFYGDQEMLTKIDKDLR